MLVSIAIMSEGREALSAIVLSLVVKTTDVVPVVRIMVELAVAPALVHQSPCDHTRVIDISLESFRPFLVEASGHFVIELIATGHLSPYKEAQAISPVVETRVFDLLMLATPIEAHRFGKLNVFLESCGCRRCHQR